MATDVTKEDPYAAIERVLVTGDLGKLTPEQRVLHYKRTCEKLGLEAISRPFEFLTLQGRTILYARKDATDQLRRIHKISLKAAAPRFESDLIIVMVEASDGEGRSDSDIGAVPLMVGGRALAGEALANALMRAITKAKRRVTLSIVGLGMIDESEIDSIPDAQPFVAVDEPVKQIRKATLDLIDQDGQVVEAYAKASDWIEAYDTLLGEAADDGDRAAIMSANVSMLDRIDGRYPGKLGDRAERARQVAALDDMGEVA